MDLRTEALRTSAAVVTVLGDVDMATAPDLERQLSELADNGCDIVVVDLNQVDFLDSSGLGVLVAVHKRMVDSGGQIRVVCGHPRIERIFAITRLNEVLPMFETVAAATESF